MTTVNLFAAPAATLAANAVAFVEANKASDTASTPFARSTLATVVGGIASLTMVETVVIAAMGSPKSEAKGKAIAKVSGLRDLPGGARLYQAWKAIVDILANIDSDAPATIGEGEEAVTVGDGSIRKLVEGFILEGEGAPKALFGQTGLVGQVKAAMTAHAKAVATAMGVPQDASNDNADSDGKGDTNAAPVTLAERIAATLVAVKAATDEEFTDNQAALAMLSDFIDTRWNAIADKLNAAPSEGEEERKAA